MGSHRADQKSGVASTVWQEKPEDRWGRVGGSEKWGRKHGMLLGDILRNPWGPNNVLNQDKARICVETDAGDSPRIVAQGGGEGT